MESFDEEELEFESAELDSDEEALIDTFEILVDKGQDLMRIDKFLVDRIIRISRSKIQEAAHAGSLTVNEQPVKPNYKIKPFDKVRILIPKPFGFQKLKAENIPLDIVYQDDDVIVIDKAAGMVVHPGVSNYTGTLMNAILHHVGEVPSTDGELYRPGLVHRLDKDTSGLMVLSKTEYALNHLCKQFFDRTIERRYVSLVWGDVEQDSGTIDANLGRHPRNKLWQAVFEDGLQGKRAVTHYKVLERFGYTTLVECKLETGRTHQIRVHMKHIGHTVFNDIRYEGNRILAGTIYSKYKQFVDNCFSICPRQALHARSLGFTHPVTGNWLQFERPLPNDMAKLVEKWRHYSTHLQLGEKD